MLSMPPGDVKFDAGDGNFGESSLSGYHADTNPCPCSDRPSGLWAAHLG
jgi:hypothetical protein